MPTQLNFNGNDDNALEALVIDAGIAFTHSGNTHEAINALADLTAVDLTNMQGNDRWMLEQFAAAVVVAPPFVYRLDDDGTLAAMFSVGYQAASGVDLLTQSHVITGGAHPGDGVLTTPLDALTTACKELSAETQAIEWRCDAFPVGDYVGVGVSIFWHTAGVTQGQVFVSLRRRETQLLAQSMGGVEVNLAGDAVGKKIGLYVKPDGAVGWTVAGIDQGLFAGVTIPAGAKFFAGIVANDYAASGGNGETVTSTLVMTAAEMTEPFPALSVDWFGAVI